MAAPGRRVAVIGAGVVGLTTAEAFLRQGAKVTIFDRQRRVARECSRQNACLFLGGYCRPKTASVLEGLKWVFTRTEPVHVSWRALLDPRFAAFGARHALAGPVTRQSLERATAVNAALVAESQALLAALAQRHSLGFATQTSGLVTVYEDPKKLAGALADARALFPEGAQWRFLDAAACREQAALRRPVAGGLAWPGDVTACPLAFATALEPALRGLGATFRLGEPVGAEPLRREFDCVVVCAGAHAQRFGLPLYGLRGHSFTLELEPGDPCPTMPVCFGDVMVFCTPLPAPGGKRRLRVAAFGDLDGWDPERVRPWRLEQLVAVAEQVLGRGAVRRDQVERSAWAGLRPMSPDQVPIVGELAPRSATRGQLLVNTGHGTLGWAQACATAERLAAGDPGPDLDPARFAWTRVLRAARAQYGSSEPALRLGSRPAGYA